MTPGRRWTRQERRGTTRPDSYAATTAWVRSLAAYAGGAVLLGGAALLLRDA
jgi:hypothetical protein